LLVILLGVQDLDDLAEFEDDLGGVGAVGPALRWVPDEQLIASVLGSPRAFRGMSELGSADRAWLVAGLTLAGLTAGEIASRLSCSVFEIANALWHHSDFFPKLPASHLNRPDL
jgi:hypothetical protein